MSTTLNKLEYLDETKKEIKNALNTNFNSGITDEDTFRSYVTKINDIYTNWTKVTGEGTELTLNNTKKGKMALTPKGNTEQTTYTGKNLLNLSSEYSVTGYKIINVNLGAGTYTISLESVNLGGNSNALMRFMNGENELAYFNVDTTHLSKTITVNDTINSIHIYSQDNYAHSQDVTSTFNKLMIEANSTATSYEPYVGGTPSPNPDYPQEVKVVTGNNSVKVVGKNLFDKSNIEQTNYYIEPTNGNHTTRTGTIIYKFEVMPNTSYVRNNVKNSSNVTFFSSITYWDKNNNYISGSWNSNQVITTPNNENVKYMILSTSGDMTTYSDTQTYLDNFMIEKGSTATTYEPYQSQTYPINLGSIELCKIPNTSYQDIIFHAINGDSFYDTLDNATKQTLTYGKWYKHSEIGKVVLDGSETKWYTFGGANYEYQLIISKDYSRSDYKPSISNRYVNNNVTGANLQNYQYSCFIQSGEMYVRFRHNDITTLADYKTWLATNNVILCYPLATPTNEEITDTTLIGQLNAIENALSYDTQTNISSEYEEGNAQMIISASALEKGGN